MITARMRASVEAMSDAELVAWWNVLQAGNRMIRVGNDRDFQDKERICSACLLERGIPHERSKRSVPCGAS